MHIFFSGIGGVAIGPLALIAKKLGYDVSGSDLHDSSYIEELRKHNIPVTIGQETADIQTTHQENPIDWYVYSSALPLQNPNHPELKFVEEQDITHSKRDQFLSKVLSDHDIKLLAVAGTHGKTTTTAMCVWLMQQLATTPFGYSVGGKLPYGPMGDIQPNAEWFVYEADEFDRNFLSFHPSISGISGVSYDHHEIYPTQNDYNQAFLTYIAQSKHTTLWPEDADRLGLAASDNIDILDSQTPPISLLGEVNRQDAQLAVALVARALRAKQSQLVEIINRFPGVSRRFEQLTANLYSDYAHTPEKIAGALATAQETAQDIVVLHEPLTNQRQHYIAEQYADLFKSVKKLYWLPSYLAREPKDLAILKPQELIAHMDNPQIAQPAELNSQLKQAIDQHLEDGDLVLALSGGGTNSLDSWLREQYVD